MTQLLETLGGIGFLALVAYGLYRFTNTFSVTMEYGDHNLHQQELNRLEQIRERFEELRRQTRMPGPTPPPLKIGDHVRITKPGLRKNRTGIVRAVNSSGARVRRNGMTGVRYYPFSQLELVERGTGDVYADFLDEHGETKAAELLRKHFPLG